MIVHTISETGCSTTSITEAIVTAVSDAENCDPLSLPPLWNEIETESLDALFAPTRSGHPRAGRVSFDYAGYAITVDIDAETTVNVSLEALEE